MEIRSHYLTDHFNSRALRGILSRQCSTVLLPVMVLTLHIHSRTVNSQALTGSNHRIFLSNNPLPFHNRHPSVHQVCLLNTPTISILLHSSSSRLPEGQAFLRPSIMDHPSHSSLALLHLFSRISSSLQLGTILYKTGFPRVDKTYHQLLGCRKDPPLVLHLSTPFKCNRCIKVSCLGPLTAGKGLHPYHLLMQARLMILLQALLGMLAKPTPHRQWKHFMGRRRPKRKRKRTSSSYTPITMSVRRRRWHGCPGTHSSLKKERIPWQGMQLLRQVRASFTSSTTIVHRTSLAVGWGRLGVVEWSDNLPHHILSRPLISGLWHNGLRRSTVWDHWSKSGEPKWVGFAALLENGIMQGTGWWLLRWGLLGFVSFITCWAKQSRWVAASREFPELLTCKWINGWSSHIPLCVLR